MIYSVTLQYSIVRSWQLVVEHVLLSLTIAVGLLGCDSVSLHVSAYLWFLCQYISMKVVHYSD